jgi:hypothetical protein
MIETEASAMAIVAALSPSQRLHVVTMTSEPTSTQAVREETYGPDWHSPHNWPRLMEDTDALISAGLMIQTIPIAISDSWLTSLGSRVRELLMGDSGSGG